MSVAVALVCALLIAGCGGSEEVADDAGAEGGAATADAAADDGAASSTEGAAGSADGDLDGLIAEAQEEGSMVIYGSPVETLMQPVTEAFNEEYGVSVEYVRLSSNDVEARFLAEVDAGAVGADLIMRSAAEYWFYDEQMEAGTIVSLDDGDVPGWPGDYPEEFLVSPGIPTLMLEPQGIAVNTDLVSPEEVPQSWEELAEPQWEGELGLNPALAGPGQLPHWDILIAELGEDWARGLGENARSVYPTNSPMAEAIAAGEISIALPIGRSSIGSQLQAGAPLEWRTFDFTSGLEFGMGLVGDAENPAAARLFAHYLMVGEGGQLLQDQEENIVVITTDGPLSELPASFSRFERGYEERKDFIHELLGVQDQAQY